MKKYEEKKYNRTEIAELDPRQCVYIHIPDSNLKRIEVTAENAELTLNSEPLYSEIHKILSKYCNRETYLWDNARGLTVVIRTERNENMFFWSKLAKISLFNNHIDFKIPVITSESVPIIYDEPKKNDDPVIQARCGLLDMGFNDTLVFSMSDSELLNAWNCEDVDEIELAMEHYAYVYDI